MLGSGTNIMMKTPVRNVRYRRIREVLSSSQLLREPTCLNSSGTDCSSTRSLGESSSMRQLFIELTQSRSEQEPSSTESLKEAASFSALQLECIAST